MKTGSVSSEHLQPRLNLRRSANANKTWKLHSRKLALRSQRHHRHRHLQLPLRQHRPEP
jgi:hypothetical protein